MKYCKQCLMPDTRPGIKFDEHEICMACINYQKQKETDWTARWTELKKLCDKYRNKNGSKYDCAIAVSGGKDSHFQTYLLKEKLKMNPLLISVGYFDWTKTGKQNIENLSDTFGCDIIKLEPNRKVGRIMYKKALEKLGSPTWYLDALVYSFPVRTAINEGIELLVYGEDINYTYGGQHDVETPSALTQSKNDVVKPAWDIWFEDGDISPKDLEMTQHPTSEDMQKSNLNPIYLSYFVPWNSHHNFEVAKKFGFRHLGHEYDRENNLDNYDQLDSLSYLLHPWMKYPKFGHAFATDMASKWIRYGLKTRKEMIPLVEEKDSQLDQGIVEAFCSFTRMSKREFWEIVDKWYNPNLFEKDNDGIWHPKFKVGVGL